MIRFNFLRIVETMTECEFYEDRFTLAMAPSLRKGLNAPLKTNVCVCTFLWCIAKLFNF